MNPLINLLGLIPNTSSVMRVKFAVAEAGAVIAGLIYMSTGIEGSILRGSLIVACGAGLLVVAARGPKEKPAPVENNPPEHLLA